MEDLVQKALEILQKAEDAANGVKLSLEKAQTDLAAKPQDKNLIKKVEGLQAALATKNTAAVEAKSAHDEAVKQAAAEATAREADEPAGSGSAGGGAASAAGDGKKTVSIRIKHKSTGTFYYRCGLRVKKEFESFSVPKSTLERLKADPYIVFEKEAR